MTKVLDPNAWKKQSRRNVVDSITAVHEAGHVVVRMLAFEESGHSLVVFKAGGWVHTLQPPRWLYADGLTYPQGPISAPFFSYEMEMVSGELRKNCDRDWNTYMATVLQVSKAAGVNIKSWFALHVLQAVSGPIAQALASNRSFAETWGGHDEAYVIWLAEIAGVDQHKMLAIINRMAAVSAYAMEHQQVRSAVTALAQKLSQTGLLPGKTVVNIVKQQLQSCLGCTFTWMSRDVAQMEREILHSKSISMDMPDGSRFRIKGRQSSKTLSYQARDAVLPETLRRAFGDDVAVKGVKAA